MLTVPFLCVLTPLGRCPSYILLSSPCTFTNCRIACTALVAVNCSAMPELKQRPCVDCDALLPLRPSPACNSLVSNSNSTAFCDYSAIFCTFISSGNFSISHLACSFLALSLFWVFMLGAKLVLQTLQLLSPLLRGFHRSCNTPFFFRSICVGSFCNFSL